MSKVNIKNVSKDRGPFYCDLSDKSSLVLQFGQSKTLEENLLTEYIRRRASLGYLIITPIIDTTNMFQPKEEKTSGKKKPQNKIKEVK